MPGRAEGRAQRGRTGKLRSLDEALSVVHSGSTVALGGLWFHNSPSAAVRELLRRGVGDLELLTAPPSSFATDLLVGAGAVRRAYLPHVSFEHLGLAPNVRRAAETGAVEIVECDEATVLGGIMASLEGLAEHPIGSLKGTDHLRTSPLVRPWRDSTGEPVVVPPALRADAALLHAQQADRHGNVRNFGAPFCDPLLAKVSDHVIVTVDEVIDNAEIRADPQRTTLPAYLVDAVVELPFGAHPCASHGRYPHDEEHLSDYLRSCRGGDLSSYVARWVTGPGDHTEYLALAGGLERLRSLEDTVP